MFDYSNVYHSLPNIFKETDPRQKKGKIPFPFNTTIRYSSGTTVGIKSKMPRFIERNISTNVIYLRKASEEDKILEAQNERLVYYELIVMDGGARTTSRISVKAIYNGPFIGMKGRAKTSSRIVQFKGNPFLFPPLFPSSSPSLSFSLSLLSLSLILFSIWKGLIEAVRESRSSCACKFVCRRCNRWECVTGRTML